MNPAKHIVVTGGAGFIGSNIAKRLLSDGYRVTILDNLTTGTDTNIPKGADFIRMDLGEKAEYKKIENLECDAIFHLAGQSSGEVSFLDPVYDLKSHALSTLLLLELCKKNKIPRFIYASSMSVYGDPEYLPVNEKHPLKPKTFYGAAKSSAENYVRLYQSMGIDTTIFRLFSVYGPGQNLGNKMQGMISIYLSYMFEGEPVLVKGSKERYRDFVYIDDVVNIWNKALHEKASYGKTYNIASGKRTKVEELLNILKGVFGNKDYQVEYRDTTPGDQFGVVADTSLVRKELNWEPRTDLAAGLTEMINFEKKVQKNA